MKISTLLFTVFLLSFSQLKAQDDLILDYTFDGNANDHSGNNNNGTVYNATLTSDRFGNPDGAYDFNGSSSYIEFPSSGSMSQLYDTGEFTISAWIKIRNWFNNWNVFSIIEQYNPNTDFGSLLLEANWATGGINFIAGYNAPSVGGNFAWNFNQWYNITVTYKIASGEINFYIDGNLLQTVAYNQGFSQDIINPYVIGRSLSGPDEYSDGVIDDLKIFKRAINAAEVSTLVSTGSLATQTIDHASQRLVVFPNPATDFIQISSGSGIQYAELFDLNGKLLFRTENITDKISLENFSKGMYLLKTQSENGPTISKIIKQ
ncbi:MAG: T9SS type A sorting domain-containing protein [Flavobacterium sp.]